ncbi:hypothetical protein B0H14DRAFT_3503384 [Mycena olivaceomarginata]|nr:hypothetical protein B0H14DRAFT_3503384 [Mycena olivaceomarginata]
MPHNISAASAKIMEEFLKEGKLNPEVRRTQAGFLKVFSAWLLEDDLSFTTGETDVDNVAANDVLIRTLSRFLMEKFDIQFTPANSQIRCIAYVVDLVVQKLLSALDETTDHKDDDYYVPSKDQ